MFPGFSIPTMGTKPGVSLGGPLHARHLLSVRAHLYFAPVFRACFPLMPGRTSYPPGIITLSGIPPCPIEHNVCYVNL
jgi:hypothetical protein